MSSGYTFLSQVIDPKQEIICTAAIAATVITGVCVAAAKKVRKANNPLIPDDKLSLRSFAEGICSFLMSLGDQVMGKENRKYLPFIGSIFVYILFLNLISLIPGVAAVTGGNFPLNFAFNFGLAIIVFIYYHVSGIRSVGIVNYLKHFMGSDELTKFPLVFIGLVVLVVEIVSNCIRPVTLSLRLFANMSADHLLLGAFTDLTKFIVPLIFYVMGTFVSFIQAFVFTMLTMIYIRLAVAHGHDEKAEDHH
ncbi:MAG: F0F1 ATP synthase subunit A [Deltaproteobacteria bacterium]|nr:F0F1 ATP synthase subunit A [Deltaproteobacteria bacterium]